MNIAPVIDKSVLKRHTLGQEKRKSRRLLAHHEKAHFLAYTAVVTLFSLLQKLKIIIKLLLCGESDTLNSGKHLVILVIFPVRAGLTCYFKRL